MMAVTWYATKRFAVLAHPEERGEIHGKVALQDRLSVSSDNVHRLPSTASERLPTHRIFLDVDCDYTRRILQEAFAHPSRKSRFCVTLGPANGMDPVPLPRSCDFQWAEYERIDWSSVLEGKHGAASYCVRKGLSRKAQLAYYTQRYAAKNNEDNVLARAVPQTLILDTWDVWERSGAGAASSTCEGFAHGMTPLGSAKSVNVKERLVACLDHAKRCMESAEAAFASSGDPTLEPIWILKGSTTNKGSGIHIVHLFEQVLDICWSESEIREWVLQRYIATPLLLRGRKFHIRAYALAVSSLKVYLSRDCLALCSGTRYRKDDLNTFAHITNTAYQAIDNNFKEDECVLLWDEATITPILSKDGTCGNEHEARSRIEGVLSAMQAVTRELFHAYACEFGVFAPIPGCFELYGLDFLVDDKWNVYLLEVNPGPDFKQTGDRLSQVILELMSSTIDIVFPPVYDRLDSHKADQSRSMVLVYNNPAYRRTLNK